MRPAEASGSRVPTLLDWLLVAPLLALGAVLAVGYIVYGMMKVR